MDLQHCQPGNTGHTQVLQDIVGAKTRTALLICCSPAASDAEETLSSLRFGIHAEDVMTGVQVLHIPVIHSSSAYCVATRCPR